MMLIFTWKCVHTLMLAVCSKQWGTFGLLAGADEDDIKNVKKELELEGFQCWETCVGSAGVAYHPTGHSDPTVPQQLFES